MVKPGQEEVDKAAAAAHRGINRLIVLLGHEDRAVLEKAALTLNDFGAAAVVGPLANALSRAKAPAHRQAIVGMLISYAGERKGQVAGALAAALKRERDPRVMGSIRAAISHLAIAEVTSGRHGSSHPA